MTETINVGDVITMLDLIIDDEDTDTLKIGHGRCQNFDEEGRPMCIAGNLYAELGIDITWRGSVGSWKHHLTAAGFTPAAVQFLQQVQSRADQIQPMTLYKDARISWREALDKALDDWNLA